MSTLSHLSARSATPLVTVAAFLILQLVAPHSQAQTQTFPAFPDSSTRILHVDIAKGETLVKEKKVVVLDIRTPAEFKEGHIKDAKNIDFRAADFEKQIAALNKTNYYLVHCASGGRSTSSLEVFKKLKFHAIVHLDGGFNAWKKEGKPVQKD